MVRYWFRYILFFRKSEYWWETAAYIKRRTLLEEIDFPIWFDRPRRRKGGVSIKGNWKKLSTIYSTAMTPTKMGFCSMKRLKRCWKIWEKDGRVKRLFIPSQSWLRGWSRILPILVKWAKTIFIGFTRKKSDLFLICSFSSSRYLKIKHFA